MLHNMKLHLFCYYNIPPQLQSINRTIKKGIQAIISKSSQQSPKAKNKKNNIIIHHAPAPKNPSSPKNLSNIVKLPPVDIIELSLLTYNMQVVLFVIVFNIIFFNTYS